MLIIQNYFNKTLRLAAVIQHIRLSGSYFMKSAALWLKDCETANPFWKFWRGLVRFP
jgi:hypothetical protein